MKKIPLSANLDGLRGNLPPKLYTIPRFKSRNVHTKLTNDNWIKNLQEVTTPTQLEELTLLFMTLSSVTLSDQKT
jgi:hypothetical protein